MKKKVTPIILSGGIGSRLWPLSTKNLPKQFLNLPFKSKNNLFEQTILGLKNKKEFYKPIIVCSDNHKFLALDILKKKNYSCIIAEKISKNTATSVLLGVLYSRKFLLNDFSLIIPSDHYIENRDYSLLIPKDISKIESHVIYGVKPTFPSINYGYIKAENSIKTISQVLGFFEKPSLTRAKVFLKKKYFWNSGIFLINNEKLVRDFKKYHPTILKYCEKIIDNLIIDLDFFVTRESMMKKIPEISFDKAILEHNDSLVMMKFNQSWRDLGSWNSIVDLSEKNTKLSNNVNIFNNSKNSNVITDKRITVLNDVSNIIVVSKKESFNISSKKSVNEIRDIQKKYNLKSLFDSQDLFYKPWGHYEVILKTDTYLLKKIVIKIGQRLSLQIHKYRSEHWIIADGKAKIIRGNKKIILKKNESTFIPIGMKHSVENIGNKNLEIIEVQMGKVLKESDITRLDDPYKR